MRVLHSAALLSPSSGMLNQMKWEQEAAHQLSLDWQVRMFCPIGWLEPSEIIQFSKDITTKKNENIVEKTSKWLRFRREYYQWLISQENSVDIFLLRYSVHDPFQLRFIADCKKPVCLVHHTLELPELASANGFVAKTRVFLENIMGRHAIQQCYATIGVTQEIVDYEKKRGNQPDKLSIVYPNGIMFHYETLNDRRGDIPELLFVASHFVEWHGLDLLLKAMQSNSGQFTLHLVGNLSADDLAMAQLDPRIVLHGSKSHQEINIISESCWLGLSSFALYRKGMKEACTLKVREYLMMGLPVYAGYKESFPETFEYYRNDILNVDSLLDFSRKNRHIQRLDISLSSKKYIDKLEILSSLSSFLELAGV
jgi:glycosyltransferase involved in cell wall biosynthesis